METLLLIKSFVAWIVLKLAFGSKNFMLNAAEREMYSGI